jgi:hypothetical protein
MLSHGCAELVDLIACDPYSQLKATWRKEHSMSNSVFNLEDVKGWLAMPWGWLIIWIPVLALFVALALIGNTADFVPWEPTVERICSYREEQRELVRTGSFFLQVANFWSNFAYLAVGLLIFCRNGSFIGRGTGLAFVFLAFGSGYYHGSLTEFGQFLDIAGIYMALLALLFHGVIEFFDLETSTDSVRNWFWFLMLYGLFAGFSKSYIPWHKSDIAAGALGVLIGGLMIYWIVSALLIEGAGSRDFSNTIGPFSAALLSFAFAAFFKYGDMTHLDKQYQMCDVMVLGQKVTLQTLEMCPPTNPGYLVKSDDTWAFGKESILQGHAIWHLLSAFGMLCIFEFFTSLRNKSGSIRPWRG